MVIPSILYSWADLRHNFHVDHMYPKSEFMAKRLKARGIPENKIDDFIADYNYIGNLQLLGEIPNIEKKAMDFNKWLAVLIEKDNIEKLYFIVETKGSVLSEDLREKEKKKIKCGHKHFEALGNETQFTETDDFEKFIEDV